MPPFRLYVISDEQAYPHALAKLLPQLHRKNEIGFQICEKGSPQSQKLLVDNLTKHISSGRGPASRHSTNYLFHCYLSDRADLALSLGLTGVHLDENSISCQHLHPFLRQNLSIGVSVHSVEDVVKAQQEGADFVTLGPIYPSTGRGLVPPAIPLGLSVLKRAKQLCDIPIFASGGVTLENALYCLEAGAYGIAVFTSIWETSSPLETIKKFEYIIVKHFIRKSMERGLVSSDC